MSVKPVHKNSFKINLNGRNSPANFVVIKDLENFDPSFEHDQEDWKPIDMEGWGRHALTGNGLTISFSGKRNFGDPGNDYVASKALAIGDAAESQFQWIFPNGATMQMDCIISVSKAGGGDTTNLDGLEFEILSDGKPTFTPAPATLVFTCVAGTSTGTKITAVTPSLTVGNAYMYKINGVPPSAGVDIAGLGWANYTLGDDIVVTDGNSIALIETTQEGIVVKGGTASVVTA